MEKTLQERDALIGALLEATSDAVLITDIDGVVLEVNEQLAQRLHTTPEALRGVNIYAVLPPALAQLRRERVDAVVASKQPIRFDDHVGEQWFEHHFAPILNEHGQVAKIVVCSRDVTALRHSETHFRRLFEVTPFPLAITRRADSQGILSNQAALAYFDVDTAEVSSLKGIDFYANPADRDVILQELHTSGKVENRLIETKTRAGERRWNLINIHPIQFDGQPCLLIGLADITDRKRMEETLQASEWKFRNVIQQSQDGLTLTDEQGLIIEWNRAMEQITGLSAADVLERPIWDVQFQLGPTEHQTPARYAQLKTMIGNVLQTGQAPWLGQVLENEYRHSDGARHFIEGVVFPIKTDNGFMLGSASRDITRRKQAEEALRQSEERFRRLAENMPILINAFGADHTYIFWNKACEQATGYAAAEILGNPHASQLLYPDPAYLQSIITKWAERGSHFTNWELTLTDKYGRPKTIAWSNLSALFPIPGWASWAIGIDVTERKRMEVELQASLNEKEALLREIHHRVKNNLQVVSSMLYLQAEATRDEHTRQSLQESQNRIQAMTLVHEQLYASDNLAEINMATYLEELAISMYHAYHVNIEQIRLQLDATSLMLSIEQAIPCGLIVQELLSNAFKHGFAAGQSGRVGIVCQRDAQRVTLKVWNSGTPFPDQIDLRKITTIGLDLVHSFTRQLRGTLELDRMAGTCFTITFPRRRL